MNITKVWKEWVVPLIIGVIAAAIYNGIQRIPPIFAVPYMNHAQIVTLVRFCYVVALTVGSIFIGRMLERHAIPSPLPGLLGNVPRQSKIFVLEVEGTQPLDSQKSNWKFFITNCTTRIVRRVEFGTLRSEIGGYEIYFNEIVVMQPGQKVQLTYQVYSRRALDRDSRHNSTLWDFGMDHAYGRGTTYFWYDIYIQYREADDDSVRDAGVVGVCFDLTNKILKVEGAEDYRKDRYRWL